MKVILCIIDGLGICEHPQLSIPFVESRLHNGVLLNASGRDVGLLDGQMGNSEVGHMTIGAGRIMKQYCTRIHDAISNNTMPEVEGEVFHLIGLLSDGAVHSHIDHILYMIKGLRGRRKKVFIHLISDGRDSQPKSIRTYLCKLAVLLDDHCKIATICGRYYAMDRDNRTERTAAAYEAIALGKSPDVFTSVEGMIDRNYENNITDEFFLPSCNEGYGGISQDDVIIFCNFRSDRMRQLAQMMLHTSKKIISMVDYFSGKLPQISHLFSSVQPRNTLSEVIAQAGKKQLKIAETEKYAHVTFFLNCGREAPHQNEERILIPSPKVATYDLQPEMSAYEITQQLMHEIDKQQHDFICVNFANADMLGHTGNFKAAQKSCFVIDQCLNRIAKSVVQKQYLLLITSDHGNIEQMHSDNQPHTAHTLNKVPFFCVNGNITKIRDGELGLRDVAPTVLDLMQLPIPVEMTGAVVFKSE